MSTVQDSLITRRQFNVITSSLLHSPRIVLVHSFMSSECHHQSPQLPTVPIQKLPQCNRLQRNVLNCS